MIAAFLTFCPLSLFPPQAKEPALNPQGVQGVHPLARRGMALLHFLRFCSRNCSKTRRAQPYQRRYPSLVFLDSCFKNTPCLTPSLATRNVAAPQRISHNTALFRFKLEDGQPLGMTVAR